MKVIEVRDAEPGPAAPGGDALRILLRHRGRFARVQRERRAFGGDETTAVTAEYLNELEAEMLQAAENLEFERAAAIRDRILQLRAEEGGGPARPMASPQARKAREKVGGKGRRRR